ncbi:MAG: hypothetical protein RBT41_10775 [Clostridia bacterium]|nr:hypothetical protein [Clostridia bacterium]
MDAEKDSVINLNFLLAEKQEEQNAACSWIWGLCWGLAAPIVVILLLDLLDVILLEMTHLTLLGGIVGLILFPFIKKLKIANVEIETILNHCGEKK